MTIIVGIILVLLSIVCFILSFRVGKKGDEFAKALEDFEAAVEVAKQELNGIEPEEMVVINDEKPSEENLQMKETCKPVEQQICERRKKWLEMEQAKKVAEQEQREQNERWLKLKEERRKKRLERQEEQRAKKLKQQEELRLATIQKIKDSLQWKDENGIFVLTYVPMDSKRLYMDSYTENKIVNAEEVIDIAFRYGGSDVEVRNVLAPCRGVLSFCVEPFYEQCYEVESGASVLKINYNESYVAAYEREQIEKKEAEERADRMEKEARTAAIREQMKQRKLQNEKSEKERIRLRLLNQKKRRELEMKVHQEMYENGELSMLGTKRRYIPQSVVSEVYRRDSARCVICGSAENLQLDHIIPFSKGGSDTADNLQVLCQKCNLQKSNKI